MSFVRGSVSSSSLTQPLAVISFDCIHLTCSGLLSVPGTDIEYGHPPNPRAEIKEVLQGQLPAQPILDYSSSVYVHRAQIKH